MARRQDVFAAAGELLTQLLAGAQPREDDFDLITWDESAHPDHLLGQINDAHLLAHIEHINLTSLSEGGRLYDEADRLGYGQEVARHLRIGHGHRTAAGDLAPERRDRTSSAADYVAESDRAVNRGVAVRHRQNQQLANPFRGA